VGRLPWRGLIIRVDVKGALPTFAYPIHDRRAFVSTRGSTRPALTRLLPSANLGLCMLSHPFAVQLSCFKPQQSRSVGAFNEITHLFHAERTSRCKGHLSH
jgi:hypothetical protein